MGEPRLFTRLNYGNRNPHRQFAATVKGDKRILVLTHATGDEMAGVIKSELLSPAPRFASTSPEVVDSAHPNRFTLRGDSERPSEPPTKKQRTNGVTLQDTTSEEIDARITAVVDINPSYDDGVQQLLRRSIAMALQTVGFDSSSKEAFEAMCSEVDSYMLHFLSRVRQSMLSSRRAQTTPLDFEYALRREELTAFLLTPHLKPPVPKEFSELHFEFEELEDFPPESSAALLGPELSGIAETAARKYIPKNFPPLPPLHTWKFTEDKPQRETDPRKIREQAAAEARLAEEALGRLMKPVKAKEYREVTERRARDPRCKMMDDMWLEMMKEYHRDKLNNPNLSQEERDDLLQPILIDPERTKYGPKLLPLRKK